MNFKIPKNKHISSVTVGEKGQIVIPKAVRDMFGIEPGDNLVLMADTKRGIAIVNFDMLAPHMKHIIGEQEDNE